MDLAAPFHWLVYQQDYLWFLVALGWSVVAVTWWRLRRRSGSVALPWLPWAAAAGIATAALEVSQLVTPIEVKPGLPPWLAWDLALGCVSALLAAGCWWEAAIRRGSGWRRYAALAIAAAVIVAALVRWPYPAFGTWTIAGVVTGAAIALAATDGASRNKRFALAWVVLSVWLGTAGPLAEWAKLPHRYTELSALGPWAAGASLCAIALTAATLWRHAEANNDHASAAWSKPPRGLLLSLTIWLTCGVALAALAGSWARVAFERDLLSRAILSENLVDKAALAEMLDSSFRVKRVFAMKSVSGRNVSVVDVKFPVRSRRTELSADLAEIEVSNPDVLWAMIITMRDGWLLECCVSSHMPDWKASIRSIFGRADTLTWLSWARCEKGIIGPQDFYYGDVVQARAPLIDANHKMLGWLIMDVSVSRWLSAQVQARLLAFGLVGLGCGVIFLNWLQRERERQQIYARRDAEAAAAASRLKTGFLAKVSHELRTPIQSLLGYSELVRQRVHDDPKSAAWLELLRQHGELMTRLVNDLVDLTAVEAGNFQLVRHTVSPEEIVTQTVESLRPRSESAGLSLVCLVDAGVPPWVVADGDRLRQVTANLVGNAIKFTDHGGVTVGLRIEAAPAEAKPAELRLVLTVRDTGPGIPPPEQGRLFQPFSRLEATAAKEGSGLGLALSAALCTAHGGTLTLESDGRTGACFTATFEVQLAVAQPAVPPVAPIQLRGRRILVVDDNPLVRELFVASLAERGALCAAAGTAAQALVQLGDARFDAAILDLALPDCDGADLARRIRAAGRAEVRTLRLVGVSAHASAAERSRALAAGMDVFLTKPVPLQELAVALGGTGAPASSPEPLAQADAALRERLARDFRRELPDQHRELAAAITRRDWSRSRYLTHQLKNSAAVLRDDALFDACVGLEAATEQANEVALVARWVRCETALARWAGTTSLSISAAVAEPES